MTAHVHIGVGGAVFPPFTGEDWGFRDQLEQVGFRAPAADAAPLDLLDEWRPWPFPDVRQVEAIAAASGSGQRPSGTSSAVRPWEHGGRLPIAAGRPGWLLHGDRLLRPDGESFVGGPGGLGGLPHLGAPIEVPELDDPVEAWRWALARDDEVHGGSVAGAHAVACIAEVLGAGGAFVRLVARWGLRLVVHPLSMGPPSWWLVPGAGYGGEALGPHAMVDSWWSDRLRRWVEPVLWSGYDDLLVTAETRTGGPRARVDRAAIAHFLVGAGGSVGPGGRVTMVGAINCGAGGWLDRAEGVPGMGQVVLSSL